MRRVVIAEDQAIAREALRLVLERESYDVAGEAAEGLEAMRLLRAQRPDILVLGLRLRRLNGIEVIRRAHRDFPSMKMLVVSEIDNPLTISQCEEAGASGFVSKAGDFAEFILALQAIARGGKWFPAQERRNAATSSASGQDAGVLGVLSLREQSVLRYLAEGFRIRDIAVEMALDDRTISTYKARLLRKLNVHSVVELADIARRYRLAPQAELPVEAAAESVEEAGTASSHAKIHTLLDALPFSVAMRALDGRVLFANHYLRTYVGPQRFEVFRTVRLREQARLFGADENSAEYFESTFIDAVSRGGNYRVDAVLEIGGEPTIIVHWGAPLADENGALTLMICGSFNVNGAERLMVDLHETMVKALSASEARAALLDTHGEDVSAPLAEAIALLDTPGEPRGGATIDRLAKARSQLQLARMRFEHLRLLGAMGEAARESRAVLCDLRQLTRRVVRIVEDSMAMLGARFPTNFSGRGSGSVWLDERRYAQLLTALLHRAANADAGVEIPVAVRTALRGGGMVDVELRIGPDRAGGQAGTHRAAEANVRDAQPELSLYRNMAQALGGDLTASGTTAAVLKLTLPRGNEPA